MSLPATLHVIIIFYMAGQIFMMAGQIQFCQDTMAGYFSRVNACTASMCRCAALHVYLCVHVWLQCWHHHSHSLWCEECPYFTYGTYSQLLNQPSKRKIQHMYVRMYRFYLSASWSSHCEVIKIMFSIIKVNWEWDMNWPPSVGESQGCLEADWSIAVVTSSTYPLVPDKKNYTSQH